MTSRPWSRAWKAMSASYSMLVLLAAPTAAGCAGTPQVRRATPQVADSRSPGGFDESRGIDVVHNRLSLDHTLLVRRSKSDDSHELHDSEIVRTGDRLRANVQTSEDAYLYLAFCAHHELAIYPSQRGIRTRAGELMVVPPAGKELVFDGEAGTEVLYVILSRAELSSLEDPHLAVALAAQRPGNMPMDCATNFEAELAKPPSDASAIKPSTPRSTNVLRGTMLPKKRISSTHAFKAHRPSGPVKWNAPGRGSGGSGANRDSAPTNAAPPLPDHEPPAPGPAMGGPRVPDYERDVERNPGAIVWYRPENATGPADVVAADEDGIAVVRHAFTHVAQASSP